MKYSQEVILAFIDEFNARQKAEHGGDMSDIEAIEVLTEAMYVHKQAIAFLSARVAKNSYGTRLVEHTMPDVYRGF